MSRFISLLSASCILVCCLHQQSTGSPVQPTVSNRHVMHNRTVPPSTGAHDHRISNSASQPHHHRKPISIVDTLIVHFINSQPNRPLATKHQKAPSDSFASHPHSTKSDNSTEDFPNPALSCTDGQTYWDPVEGKCANCTTSCPAGAYVSRVCNRTHDLECQCHKGSYMSVVDKTCKPCAECPYGWGK